MERMETTFRLFNKNLHIFILRAKSLINNFSKINKYMLILLQENKEITPDIVKFYNTFIKKFCKQPYEIHKIQIMFNYLPIQKDYKKEINIIKNNIFLCKKYKTEFLMLKNSFFFEEMYQHTIIIKQNIKSLIEEKNTIKNFLKIGKLFIQLIFT